MPSLIAVTEPTPQVASADVPALLQDLEAQLKERLGISCQVVLAEPGGLPRTEVGKAVRVQRWRAGEDNPLPGVLS